MKKKILTFFRFLIGVVIFAVVIGGAYYFFSKNPQILSNVLPQKQTAKNSEPELNPTETTEQTANPAVSPLLPSKQSQSASTEIKKEDLDTYKDKNVEFKYLKGLEVDAGSGNISITKGNATITEITYEKTNGKTLQQYLDDETTDKLDQARKITFAGLTAYEGVDGGSIRAYTIYVVDKGIFYRFVLPNGGDPTLDSLKSSLSAVQKEFLKSFEFES